MRLRADNFNFVVELGTGFDGVRELAISGPAMDRLTTNLNLFKSY